MRFGLLITYNSRVFGKKKYPMLTKIFDQKYIKTVILWCFRTIRKHNFQSWCSSKISYYYQCWKQLCFWMV